MTFITDKLQELIDEYEDEVNTSKAHPNVIYGIAYLDGLKRAKQEVIRAEAELERRIWQAWVNEGVEPR